MLFVPYVRFHIFSLVLVTESPPIGKIATLSAYNSFFSHLGFWSGNLFVIPPVPDHCLLLPFHHRFLEYIFLVFNISSDI